LTQFFNWEPPEPSSQAKFDAFHAANPHIYDLFINFAFRAMRKGRTRYSARTLLHVIRWHTTVETDDPAGFKINNLWSPYYARLFETDYPEHAGFFEKRKSQADCSV